MLRIKKTDLANITLDEGKYKMAAIFRLKYLTAKIFYKWFVSITFKYI